MDVKVIYLAGAKNSSVKLVFQLYIQFLLLYITAESGLLVGAVEYTDCISAEKAQPAETVEYTDCTSAEG